MDARATDSGHARLVRGLVRACSIAALVVGCAGEPQPPASSAAVEVRPIAGERVAPDRNPLEPEVPASPAEVPDPFEAALPTEACPDVVAVAISHTDGPQLPVLLELAVAFRSEDGRHVRVAVANHSLELDHAGRFARPELGQVRFEMDATRTRRGALEPRVLGPPSSRWGGLTHVRLVTAGPLLTFGHRNIGRVELTEVGPDRVCGRIELDDGFGRVRGAFTARVVGRLPD